MQYMDHAYTKKAFVVYQGVKFNWVHCMHFYCLNLPVQCSYNCT